MFSFLRLSIVVFLTMQFLGCMTQKDSLIELRSKILSTLELDKAVFGVVFRDLQTGQEILVNEKENFHAASTMKTPLLIEIFRQANAGRFSLQDSIEIKNIFSSIVDGTPYSLTPLDDSEQSLYTRIGEKESIYNLSYAMIIRSSNLATNILIELVSAESIMATLKEIGANDIKVRRGVEDNKAYNAGLNNTTTAYDLMLIYDAIATNKWGNKPASDSMINILLDQEFREIIPAQLPAEVKVAHKTGSITGVAHDSGIIFLPDGRRYVLILLSRFDPAIEKKAVDAMASVSKLLYDFMLARK